MAATTSSLLQLLLLLAVFLALTTADLANDWFDTLDLNHDEVLDKSEWTQGLEKLTSFLRQPLQEVVSSTSTSGSSSWQFPEVSLVGFWKAFTSAVAMILATEIGDKTFFIAAVLSMKHARSVVFGGAILALIIMTILSTAMGVVLPHFIPKQYTHWLGGILFLYFGFKLLYESRDMDANRASEELGEVEEELLESNKKTEEGLPSVRQELPKKQQKGISQIFLQALTLTFLAEWGDRSQIATIALAASKNAVGVTLGGCVGHTICTGLAVLGGRMLASRISEKRVHQGGGVIFLLFGLHSIFLEE